MRPVVGQPGGDENPPNHHRQTDAALRYRGIETELGRRVAIILARLLSSSLGIEVGIHHRASRVTSQAMFRGLAAAEPRSRKGALGLLIFRERGVHEIGTVVFTVSA